MFTLNLLGGAAFCGHAGPVDGRAAHRRRVALLAILALARGRTVGRERIAGLLWPEQTTSRARHLLSESLYVLRKELGADAFVSAGDEVGLNGGVVTSDVEEFEAAVEAGGAAVPRPLSGRLLRGRRARVRTLVRGRAWCAEEKCGAGLNPLSHRSQPPPPSRVTADGRKPSTAEAVEGSPLLG